MIARNGPYRTAIAPIDTAATTATAMTQPMRKRAGERKLAFDRPDPARDEEARAPAEPDDDPRREDRVRDSVARLARGAGEEHVARGACDEAGRDDDPQTAPAAGEGDAEGHAPARDARLVELLAAGDAMRAHEGGAGEGEIEIQEAHGPGGRLHAPPGRDNRAELDEKRREQGRRDDVAEERRVSCVEPDLRKVRRRDGDLHVSTHPFL
ncbi:MAG TPA: hypothetical protein VKA80_05085, partial [Beijerinckiaceae bacterium]|nr:hypothetical protein [Beijerinckiaceae bacterium]